MNAIKRKYVYVYVCCNAVVMTNSEFAVCCDNCFDWFHNTCAGLTKKQGCKILRIF